MGKCFLFIFYFWSVFFCLLFADCRAAADREEAVFMRSKFGNAVLMDKLGYVYRSNLKKESRMYWRCRDYERFKCNARAVTDGFYVMCWTGTHNHSSCNTTTTTSGNWTEELKSE